MLTVNFDILNNNLNNYEQAIDVYQQAVKNFANGTAFCNSLSITVVLNKRLEYLRKAASDLEKGVEASSVVMRMSFSRYKEAEEKVNTKFGINNSPDTNSKANNSETSGDSESSDNGLVKEIITDIPQNPPIIVMAKNTTSRSGKPRVTKLSNVSNNIKTDPNVKYDNVAAASRPNFNNTAAWKTNNIYYKAGYCGQCTWFAAGKFYEVYGYAPGFNGNGRECAAQLVSAHPDKFALSDTPVAGAIFSCGYRTGSKNHTGMVVAVNGDQITIQHGNMNGRSDSFAVAITDWREQTMSLAEFKRRYNNDVVFANPIKTA